MWVGLSPTQDCVNSGCDSVSNNWDDSTAYVHYGLETTFDGKACAFMDLQDAAMDSQVTLIFFLTFIVL